VEHLTEGDIDAIVQLSPDVAGHRLTAAELSAALFADDQPTWVYGRAGVGVVATASNADHGFVRLLAVAEGHHRRGVGRELLGAAERHLAESGAVDVTLGADAPHHIWAGVPTDATAMCCLAEALRYRREGLNLDVDIPLKKTLPADYGGWRLARPDDVGAVVAFCQQHHPHWANEAQRAAVAGTLTLVFDRDGDELTGFCAFDVNRRGTVGPVAVRPDLVGHGVGRPVMLGALHAMRARGDTVAAVQWVGPLRPYIDLGGHISRQYVVYRKPLT
jgi:GNAT superfamily N-acetyltransferase